MWPPIELIALWCNGIEREFNQTTKEVVRRLLVLTLSPERFVAALGYLEPVVPALAILTIGIVPIWVFFEDGVWIATGEAARIRAVVIARRVAFAESPSDHFVVC